MRAPITQPTGGTTAAATSASRSTSRSPRTCTAARRRSTRGASRLGRRDAIETYLRTGNNITLGGACYNAFLELSNMTPLTAWETVEGFDDPVPAGRIAALDAVVKAWIRI
jgi:hypothetical protein